MSENLFPTAVNTQSGLSENSSGSFREAVCIDAFRVYDSCADKDCLKDLRVYFTEAGQHVIDQACTVRIKSADVLTVYVDLEPVPFNKGFYSVDMTFFFEVNLDVFLSPAATSTIFFHFSTLHCLYLLLPTATTVPSFFRPTV